MTEQTDATAVRGRLTWRRCGWIVGLILVAGVGLAATRPVWLVPPHMGLTPLVYLVLALLWIPALVICALLRPVGRARVGVLVLVIGLLITGSWCACFNVNAGWAALPGSTFQCWTEPAPQADLVRYTCVRTALYDTKIYVLEGVAGSPFAWLVEIQHSGS